MTTTGHPQGSAALVEHIPARSEQLGPRPVLDVVIPVYNEETDLEPCVTRLRRHLVETFPYPFQITIADNASTDRTLAVANHLEATIPEVAVLHLDAKGRGRALRTAWGLSQAPVLAYMDVDLSTDLRALLPLVAPLISGHSDLAIGSRLAPGARVVRGPKREVISRCYNLLLRRALAARFSDAQCGFKAIRRDVARALLPLVQDTGWFFDTELLVLAERSGLRIYEVPVDWVDDPDSRVDIMATAMADLRGIARLGRDLATGRLPVREVRAQLGRRPLTGGTQAAAEATGQRQLIQQLARFGAIGIASTAAYLALFVLLRGWFGAQGANFFALLVTAIANTAANRRLTFGQRGVGARSQIEGLIVFGLGLALTSGALGAVRALAPGAGRGVELSALIAANLMATLLRFVAFRAWVFHPRRTEAVPGHPPTGQEPTEPVPGTLFQPIRPRSPHSDE
ncbi:bifunctional glycosyltransferase family 2/GtrA family protein [Pseudofrankia inefficax]|uniref:dolichyl-phosphate beta-glucosyltransferase n=1 Tax=Pseudofrankia inefficax (strain DSM 45817 / CECT 9037 / DDB 130130 / EuI1c) TaxID=298654 RepID=E3JB28_PSEI1|nr:bifunctional glycosyltransferase family 2/GtrA family protein [Pseudofrankia inefficax]ADP84649.1 glycosyl transferase family 2 [Pseudofrankia inefficax]